MFLFRAKHRLDDFLTAVGPAIACLIVHVHLRYSTTSNHQRLRLIPGLEIKSLKVLRVDLDLPWLLSQSVPANDMILSVAPGLVKAAKSLELLELGLDLTRPVSWWIYVKLNEKTVLRYVHTMAELFEERLRILGSDARVLVV